MLSADACCCSSAAATTSSEPLQQLTVRQVSWAPHATTKRLPHAAARLTLLPAGQIQCRPHTKRLENHCKGKQTQQQVALLQCMMRPTICIHLCQPTCQLALLVTGQLPLPVAQATTRLTKRVQQAYLGVCSTGCTAASLQTHPAPARQQPSPAYMPAQHTIISASHNRTPHQSKTQGACAAVLPASSRSWRGVSKYDGSHARRRIHMRLSQGRQTKSVQKPQRHPPPTQDTGRLHCCPATQLALWRCLKL